MLGASDASAIVEFGRFRVEPRRRELLADGQPIKLGGRAFDLLIALIEASGAVVSKDVLLDRVWPGRIVEENRLQNQVSALRKAFGADHDLNGLSPAEVTSSQGRSAHGQEALPAGRVPGRRQAMPLQLTLQPT